MVKNENADMKYTYFVSRAREMRRDLLVDAVDVLFFVGFLAGSGGGGGILRLFRSHDVVVRS